MKLYNSLARKVEEFKPVRDGEISIYSCGPTVYERAHIGNLASFIYADTLQRALALEFPQAKIKHVMNITDVDDKTIKRSQEEHPDLEPMEALKKLTRHYEDLFMKDLQAVGVDVSAITFVRATEYIPQMQELIRKLVAAGIGYIADDGVYFSIKKYKAAGKTYGQLVDITAEGTGAARVNNDEYDKDNVHDFALWKKQKPGEPAWDFEIDGKDMQGRPGWHIECSAMSVEQLGQPFDIHTGGVDLKFPHHENEIAQSTAAVGEDLLARFFFHSEHMLVDGKKMSKSLNNFYTLEDVTAKGFDPLAFRLLVLQAHYHSQAHFSWKNLKAAGNRLKNWQAVGALIWQILPTPSNENIIGPLLAPFQRYKEVQLNWLRYELDTPRLLSEIDSILDLIIRNGVYESTLTTINSYFNFVQSITGIDVEVLGISDNQKQLIAQREEARQNKDFKKSDELRSELEEQGIGLRDTPYGPIWYRL